MNTQSTYGDRNSYFQSMYDLALKNALVAEKICAVDNTEQKYIQNPYGSTPTATIQAVAGTYSVSAWTVTDDALTVTDEVTVGEHIYKHEDAFSRFDLQMNRIDAMTYAVAYGIDKFVLNNLCEDATGAYTTPAGGFTTSANVPVILSNIVSTVAGYAPDLTNGMYLVIENTDLVGFIQFGVNAGFSFADAVLNNGKVTSIIGVDIYVVRSGTFVSATIGTTTVTNSGHRVAGVKNMATYASPRGITYDEKQVTGKTGFEMNVNGLIGFKLWAVKAGTQIDITIS